MQKSPYSDLDAADYPKYLAVFEEERTLRDEFDVQRFLSTHPKISKIKYLAYVAQVQLFDSSFRGLCTESPDSEDSHFAHFVLRSGEDFFAMYANDPLLFRDQRVSPYELRNIRALSEHFSASHIRDERDGIRAFDQSGTIENRIGDMFNRALTEWKGDQMAGWTVNYPYITIAAVCHPKFTQEVVRAGEAARARTKVYDRDRFFASLAKHIKQLNF